ncbi:transporter permease [Adhaeribacter arboris]|uniref:Transporter permease n=1 Tax=Adhaeribacter arboris TaxID=2072846 RepID=A0A2T2YI08_9BACT|nr:ABC transporter permease [Adhaeribacter arboris]PSR55132.1 transporter permease [Adhaeribacter arboris]
MLQHTLLLAYRSFLRFKSTFLINLIGLSTGMACTLFIYLWVNSEVHVDKFHAKDERLFQVMERRQNADDIIMSEMTSGPVAETLVEEMPEVEYAAAVMHYSWFPKFTLSIGEEDRQAFKGTGQFASQDFFQVFSYGLIQGQAKDVLRDKNAIVLSEELAQKLFHTTQNAVGKTMVWKVGPLKKPVIVTGIFKDVPANSSEQFDFLLSFEAWKDINPGVLEWGNNGTHTYAVLKAGANPEQFNSKITNLLASKVGSTNRQLLLKPYSQKYLYGHYENGVQTGGRIVYVKLFSVIALFILLIACINFMNLSTAKASSRTKEIGVKKVMGATRNTLVWQYLSESLLMAFISLGVALLLVVLLLPAFNQITDKQLTLTPSLPFILAILMVTLCTGLIAGSYPALYLSGFNPVAVLKGKLQTVLGEVLIRKGLVVFQFSLSVILIVAVLVVYRQIGYIQTKQLGYDKDNIIYFDRQGKLYENLEAFLAAVKNTPGVVNASSISSSIIGSHNTTGGLDWEGKNPNESIDFELVSVNYDLLQMLGIQMAAGRAFSKNFATDNTKIIFNEAAITAMGLKDPVGKNINLWGTNMEIVGVAKDFHFESLHENVKPLFFRLEPPQTNTIMVKTRAGQTKAVIGKLRHLYEEFNPGFTFDYTFLDQDFQAQYVAEQRVAILSRYFAGLAILISCLGLFGLAAFTAERRRKEIGVRKVLGASRFSIVYLLSGDFTKLVVISIGVALPVSYLIVKNWLQDFEYRVALEWWYFIGAGLAALVIAWLTVSTQAVKAASANPTQSLKDE